jgi:phospholipase C
MAFWPFQRMATRCGNRREAAAMRPENKRPRATGTRIPLSAATYRRTVMPVDYRGAHPSDYLICRSTDVDDYSVWHVNIDGGDGKPLLHRVSGGTLDRKHQLIPIGNYILEWGPIMRQVETDPGVFPFHLLKFDASRPDPLGGMPVIEGSWRKKKFVGSRPDFGNPDGAAKEYAKGDKLMLVPLGTFVLWMTPTVGRGTFKVFHFDPGSKDVLIEPPNWIYGSFDSINFGHELIPLGNYVIDRLPNMQEFCLWSFDPMDEVPLARSPLRQGRWDDIDKKHQLIPIGEHVLDWDISSHSYRIWRFDPKSGNPLTGPVQAGPMSREFDAQITSTGLKGNVLTGVQALCPISEAHKDVPGTIDFMRTKIKHVVYYMIENCSFDQVCGWLYEKGEEGVNFVGRKGPFQGAKADMFNVDIDAEGGPQKMYLKKWNNGEVPAEGKLEFLKTDPYHDMTDVMRQYFFDGRRHDFNGYANRVKPHMGGFVWNNGNHEVMLSYTPEQLPVLNGLAKAFAISDEWFCSTPGATDANRAFALTGSALRQLDNFMNGPIYTNWPSVTHRASIWKVLWANGFDDWKIYSSMLWPPQPQPPAPQIPRCVLTYHLFLEGQIKTIDEETKAYLEGHSSTSKYLGTINQFLDDARQGNLPTFSFLEPIWILGDEPATSYHPSGDGGKGAGEAGLNKIYEALKSGPNWNETLFVVTFDEHAGVFDHVPPPYAENPWPRDEVSGFGYDLMGPRVPTILVSPWIKEQTVFRSPTPVAYDSTSILATLLSWYGIPKARWGLGERTHHAPTFEGLFQNSSPRRDAPSFEPARSGVASASVEESAARVTDLHELVAFRVVSTICGGKHSADETTKIACDILSRATDVKILKSLISDLAKRMA